MLLIYKVISHSFRSSYMCPKLSNWPPDESMIWQEKEQKAFEDLRKRYYKMMKGKVKGKEQKSSKLKIFIVKTRPLEISWLLPQKKKKKTRI